MKRCAALLAFLAVSAFADQAARIDVGPEDPRIAYMGRTELSGRKAHMGFPGVTVRFAYAGVAPVIRMTADSPGCYFDLSCNGWDPVLIHLKEGPNDIALPTGTAPESGWTVDLVRRTESWMGTASFDGLSLPPGCTIVTPRPWPARKLMFIGDSLTCGEYDERFPPENDSTPRSTNAVRSYGMLVARWLDAQVHLISYGGRGITRDWAGHTDVNTLPVFFPSPPMHLTNVAFLLNNSILRTLFPDHRCLIPKIYPLLRYRRKIQIKPLDRTQNFIIRFPFRIDHLRNLNEITQKNIPSNFFHS